MCHMSPAGRREKLMNTFINLTNHPSVRWSEKQRKAAEQYGVIEDLPFPQVSPDWSDDRLNHEVEHYFDLVQQKDNPAVLLQGDFLFTYRLVCLLKQAGIKVLAACCSRKAVEQINPNGSVAKESIFNFVDFREY